MNLHFGFYIGEVRSVKMNARNCLKIQKQVSKFRSDLLCWRYRKGLDYRRHFPTTGRNVQVISVENSFFCRFFHHWSCVPVRQTYFLTNVFFRLTSRGVTFMIYNIVSETRRYTKFIGWTSFEEQSKQWPRIEEQFVKEDKICFI